MPKTRIQKHASGLDTTTNIVYGLFSAEDTEIYRITRIVIARAYLRNGRSLFAAADTLKEWTETWLNTPMHDAEPKREKHEGVPLHPLHHDLWELMCALVKNELACVQWDGLTKALMPPYDQMERIANELLPNQ